MTCERDFVQPPRTAASLVNLFAPTEEAEALVGDLLEEFIQRAHKSGIAIARKWYWRQSVKSIACLMLMAFRGAPWATLAVTIGGLFLHRIVQGLPDKALSAITDRYLWYWSSHFEVYIWVLYGLPLVHLTGSMLVGCVVAFAAKGREMVATMTLALVLFAMFGVDYITHVAHFSLDIWMFQSLGFFAILVGGAIVRTVRSSAISRSRAHRA